MKKFLTSILAVGAIALTLVACSGNRDKITVISREDGSGTRGAFVELLGIEEKNSEGVKVDRTITTAEITEKTSVMMTSVEGNVQAIGYISLGSLNDTVKALEIDNVAATVDNIKNGSYKVARPFNIAVKESSNSIVNDFILFIMSTEGQAVVESSGYISEGNTGSYIPGNLSGKIVVGGSSSVTPVMESLKEAYVKLNPNVSIEIQMSDSTTGMNSTIEGIYDIGMASRDLKESELEKGLIPTAIAMDGIAVIVNINNEIDGLTSEQVKDIYIGNITKWSELK
ncbi:MAG: substrate-binding domain-containing protein [Lachnospiraceae bacterium]|nr:substrate-binding domain-containing protein [Lachnospiraceae bacterium]